MNWKTNNLGMFIGSNRWVFFILFIAVIIRLSLVVATGDVKSVKGDSASYDDYAINILENESWLVDADFKSHFSPPGYPLFLSAVYKVFGKRNHQAVFFIQALLNLIMLMYIYRFSREISDEKAAFLSLAWSSVYILYLYFMPMLLRETLICLLLLLFFYYLYRLLIEVPLKKYFIGIIILFTLLIHTDPRYLFYVPFLSVLFIFYSPSYRIGIRKYCIFVASILILMTPWTIRNYFAYDGLVIINTRTYDSRAAEQIRLEWSHIKNQNYILSEVYPTEEEREQVKKGLNPNNRTLVELEAIKQDKRAAKDIKSKLLFNFIGFWKPVRFWSGYRNYPDGRFFGSWSLEHNVSSMIGFGLLLPCMIFHVVYSIYKRKLIVLYLTFPLIVHTILHVILSGRERYRVHVDSFVLILGTMGIVTLFEIIRKNRKTSVIFETRRFNG